MGFAEERSLGGVDIRPNLRHEYMANTSRIHRALPYSNDIAPMGLFEAGETIRYAFKLNNKNRTRVICDICLGHIVAPTFKNQS